MNLSVIICTHNPRPDYLGRVLDALQAQTLSKDRWELLLIDNLSKEPLERTWDLSWHPCARHIREDELGLTPARLRGIKESCGENLVFVDDDNVLNPDYLRQTLAIDAEWLRLGIWGGSSLPEFEIEPPLWSKPYLRYLALREVTEDRWSNSCDDPGALPWGAGMCVRRPVAIAYALRLAADPVRRRLGRRGTALTSCEDSDLAALACELGLGTGLFSTLKLTHLIPAGRLSQSYLLKLMEGQVYSLHVLAAARGKPPPRISFPRWLWGHVCALRRGLREFRFHRASVHGARLAAREIAASGTTEPRVIRREATTHIL